MQVLGNMVMALLVKYWIYICGGMFFIVSFEGTIVMYKIIYMMMFLSCVALYQVPTHTRARGHRCITGHTQTDTFTYVSVLLLTSMGYCGS